MKRILIIAVAALCVVACKKEKLDPAGETLSVNDILESSWETPRPSCSSFANSHYWVFEWEKTGNQIGREHKWDICEEAGSVNESYFETDSIYLSSISHEDFYPFTPSDNNVVMYVHGFYAFEYDGDSLYQYQVWEDDWMKIATLSRAD